MARVVIPDVPHHVTQRGNRGEDVFFKHADGRLSVPHSAQHMVTLWDDHATRRPPLP